MYQRMRISVIRDPGGDSLIRCQGDLCGRGKGVVDGSLLLVPPNTTAYAFCNGVISPAIPPGRYELLNTGIPSPFFHRLKIILTRGDPGTDLRVFFISERTKFYKLGTGELLFTKRLGQQFSFTMTALAACGLAMSVSDPLRLIKTLVGSCTALGEENVEACYRHAILTTVREALSREINKLTITEFNSHLTDISSAVFPVVSKELDAYGLHLASFKVEAINIPESERSKLFAMEQKYVDTDVEFDNLQRIFGGSLKDRTAAEALTGIPSRGQILPAGTGGGMVTPLIQLAMLSRAMKNTDLFDGITDMYTGAFSSDDEKKGTT